MFITKDSAEETFPPGLAGPGVHAWWNVFLPLTVPWYFVSYSARESDGEFSHQIVFLSEVSHLVDLSKIPDVKITSVELVSPGHMNGTEKWRMDSLAEIWSALDHNKSISSESYIFVIEDGRQYVYSVSNETVNELEHQECLLKI